MNLMKHHTTNLCKKCFSKTPTGKKEKKPLSNVQWRQVVEKEGVSGKNVENLGERTISAWDVGVLSPRKEA